jgi:DNA-binding transcriptional regulator YiaG
MSNIAAILKNEIARVARKEVRAETHSLKKAVAAYRGEIAALKRGVSVLEQKVRQLSKSETRNAREAVSHEQTAPMPRFSAKGFASHRRRLGLSAHECGLLVGVTSQSVYHWESGEVKPRSPQLPAIAAFRLMSKREAAAQLAARAKL